MSGASASGVMSRRVRPVPPVVTIASTFRSAIQARNVRAQCLHVILENQAARQLVAGGFQAFDDQVAGGVVFRGARVRYRKHGDVERDERTFGFAHNLTLLAFAFDVNCRPTAPLLGPRSEATS